MTELPGHPFASIESSHEYVAMLLQAIEETSEDVGEDLRRTRSAGPARRHEAFQLIAYKVEQLRFHVAASRRLLNDLRTLRRMLHGERSATPRASLIPIPCGVPTAVGPTGGGAALFEPVERCG